MSWIFSGPQIMLIPILLLGITGYYSEKGGKYKSFFNKVFAVVAVITILFIFILMFFSLFALHQEGW